MKVSPVALWMFPDSTGELLGELEVSSGATDFSARLSLKVSSLQRLGRKSWLPGNSPIKAAFT